MGDGFASFVPEAQDYCQRLSENMNRAWFLEHKAEYEAKLKRPAELLLEALAPKVGALAGGPVKVKLFRINRDVRFSKDKTPYKDYLHMLWYAPSDAPCPPGWFFGIEKDRVRVGAGFMSFDGAALTRYREAVAGPDGEAIAEAVQGQLADGATMREAALKRVPAPYGPDHPRGELLKRKGLAFWRDLAPEGDLGAAILSEFDRFQPGVMPIHAALNS
ncbi:DUF2461 domain-containing protein [Pseudooceanicola sp. C21-150M6]|uniref:DUF2461 domain-containing protein n=1 Tax=Pseudooceanicola sp. C21-150M6 TaxID=3434355 RepID=UPI003D7F5134